MSPQLDRRSLLKSAGAVGAGFWLGAGVSAEAAKESPNEKINIGVIGVGGRGGANLNGVKSQNIVALCDVDEKRAGKAFQKFDRARRFHDYREMFDRLGSKLDAVVISTPDHTHFHSSHQALSMGLHLYLEKPMAHSVWEVRELTKLAADKGVATQLGVQRHTIKNIHRVVELIQAGAIGTVKEVHSWIGGDRGMPKIPTDRPPVPDHLKWDLWVGPAAARSYHPSIAPYGWRFWWDYGTGETGNWGCHILDIPFWALDLSYPTSAGGSGPTPHSQTASKSMKTWFDFPAKGDRPGVRLYWHHAKNGPDVLRKHNLPSKGNNTLFIGSDGMLLCGFSQRALLPREKFADYKAPPQTIPDSPGFYNEWFSAIRGGQDATCAFDYSGPLAETVLLGNIAYRAQTEFKWNAEKLEAVGSPRAQQLIKTEYRKGWEFA